MFVVNNRKLFYILSGILMLGSLVSLLLWGLKPGIDFRGGSLLEVSYAEEAPAKTEVEKTLEEFKVSASVRPTGEEGYIIRMRELSESERAAVIAALSAGGEGLTVERFDSVGPILGQEAAGKSFAAIGLVILCIVLFITFAFRKVSEPVSSWKYGIITIIALVHDVLVPAGVFAYLGHFRGVEVDTLFVTALLVVLGFSVHDTIVVFDRVRENLKVSRETRDKKDFATIVGESIEQTFVRSINTSLTTIFAIAVLYVIGPEITKHFSLALLIGLIAGTYSSIFLASPLLVTVEKWQTKGGEKSR
ncbi:MAG: protein translocase subunit SecF [bacterium]|nr:protein translocase subunit SecF [bacterium]